MLFSIALAACGGGGSSITISGVAATGAAFTDVIVTVTDSNGSTVGTSSKPVGADGTYTIALTAGAVAPFVLTASRTSEDGIVESLISVIPTTSGATATANITPVTNLIASRLSSSGDPLKLATELAAKTTTIDATTVGSKMNEVQAMLGPILTATGTSSTNPLTGSFSVDGTGYDRLLDSMFVTITPSSATTTNIELGIKQQMADGDAPVTIQFTNQTAAASIPALPAITATTLIPSGTGVLITQHLAQLNSCFALPLTSRITSGGTTAATIQAPECVSAFYGNDPRTFKNDGNIVGKNNAFNGIFVDGGTGLVFSRGTYEFTRANGDIVINYRSKTVAGNETFGIFVLRKDTDGKLKQIGNQYAYPGSVSAYHQFRQFITLNQSNFSYFSTGYNLYVDHITGGTGVDSSIFDRVVITTPKGNTLILMPRSGYSYLPLVKSGPVISGTNFLRLRSEYADTANSSDPALKDTSLFFADRDVFTNAYISSIQNLGVWRFDYFLAGNTGATPNTMQYYRTRGKALTIPELKWRQLATLLPADIADIQTKADPATGRVPLGGYSDIKINYAVPVIGLPPTAASLYGDYDTGKFNDSTTMKNSARVASLQCTPTGPADLHCTGAAGSPYVSTAFATGADLRAWDLAGRGYASFYALYKLP